MNAPLPDAAITAAADAIHFWPAGDGTTCACLPGHPTARYDNDRNYARLTLEAAAPALRAQGAATERARIRAAVHAAAMKITRPRFNVPGQVTESWVSLFVLAGLLEPRDED